MLATVLAVQAIGTLLALVLVVGTGEMVAPAGFLTWAAVGGIGGLVGVTALYLALSRGTMGLVAPLTGVIAAAVPLGISLFTGQGIHPVALLGMLLALLARSERSPCPSLLRGTERRSWVPTLAPGSRSGRWSWPRASGSRCSSGRRPGARRARGHVADAARGTRVALVVVLVAVAGMAATHRLPSFTGVPAAAPVLTLSALGDMGGDLFYVLALGQTTLAVAVVLSSLYRSSRRCWHGCSSVSG